MSGRKSPVSISKFVDGFPIPPPFSDDNFRSAIHYKPRPDDIFIVTYPKCGTTWVQHILILIMRGGQPFDSPEDMHHYSPFLDNRGSQSADKMKRPGAIKTHLPFHLAPWSPENKYIYVARNPLDCCVSYFHHTSGIPNYFSGTFDEYFEMFIEGLVDFGDYFDHLVGWYAHRNDPIVFFTTYEDLKEDFESNVLKMAEFIDDEKYAKPIREDPKIMENIKKYSSFEFLKEANLKLVERDAADRKSSENKHISKDLAIKEMHHHDHERPRRALRTGHYRKGIVGDWKNYFSVDQAIRLKEKFVAKTQGTELVDLWSKHKGLF